ncbi:hypothetical protein EON65_50275 [archaeon]|nr:MAG: hypothetical protein EON65_50275 [archaeon]
MKCTSAPQQIKLNDSPYIGQRELESDLTFEIEDGVKRQGGVRIVWSVGGAGKTTTIRHMLDKMINEKKISGAVYITPSLDKDASAVEWLENATKDIFGPIITRKDKISDILGCNVDKPFVIVFDQVEGTASRAKGFEELVRGLAYDSDSCKAYISLVVTSDVHLAEEVYLWNGGTKISFLGSHKPWEYKWTQTEAEAWIERFVQQEGN